MISQYGVVTPAAVGAQPEATDFWRIGPRYSSTFEAYVPIQNGCDKYCTFCAVPYTRGAEVSRPSDDIITEIRGLLDRGYVSFTLLGQNVNSYGKDRPGDRKDIPGSSSATWGNCAMRRGGSAACVSPPRTRGTSATNRCASSPIIAALRGRSTFPCSRATTVYWCA